MSTLQLLIPKYMSKILHINKQESPLFYKTCLPNVDTFDAETEMWKKQW